MAEHIPPPTPIMRKNCQCFSAIPICRSCVIKFCIDASALFAFPAEHVCNIEKCENPSAYLYIQ